MNRPSDTFPASKRAHKKIQQRINLLCANPDFLREIQSVKRTLRALIKQAAKLADAQIKCVKDMVKFEMESDIDFDDPKFQTLPQYKKRLHRQSEVEKELEKIKSDQRLKGLVDELSKRYELYPLKSWRGPIISFILFDNFLRPDFSDFRLSSFLKGNDFREVFRMAVIAATIRLREENFGVVVKRNAKTNEPILYVQILKDTSRDDVVAGWKKVKAIQKILFKGGHYYPVSNLELMAKIATLDLRGIDDWKKLEMIYGDDDSADWGQREKRRVQAIQRTRSRSKKRFRTKS